MNSACKHHIVKPLAGKDGTPKGSRERIRFSADSKEYYMHPNSLHFSGTPGGVTCGGDAKKCDIPKAGR